MYNMQNMLPVIDILCTIALSKLPSVHLNGDPAESYAVQSGVPLSLFFFKCL